MFGNDISEYKIQMYKYTEILHKKYKKTMTIFSNNHSISIKIT